MRRHDSAPPNGLTGQMLFSLPHANPMEQSPNQLPNKLPILKFTCHREIEILSDVIYIHQPMLPAKCYCFAVAKTNAAISLERLTNVQLLCLQAERRRQRRRSFFTAESLIEQGWKLTLARGELNSIRASGLSD